MSQVMEQTIETTTLNGIAVDKLFETIEAVGQTPAMAEFTFRASNRWVGGTHTRSTIKTFYGAGQEDLTRVEPFILDADEPIGLLGTDTAANPIEYLLHALATCMTTSLVCHASARGIRIEEVTSRVEGDIDLRGFLDLDANVPRGCQSIRVTFRVKADVPDDQLEAVMNLAPTFSPVFDTITRAVNVEVALER